MITRYESKSEEYTPVEAYWDARKAQIIRKRDALSDMRFTACIGSARFEDVPLNPQRIQPNTKEAYVKNHAP